MAKKRIAEAMDIAIAQAQQEAAAAPPQTGTCGFCGVTLADPVAGLCESCDAGVQADEDGELDAEDGASGQSDDRFCKGCQAELSADHDGDVCEECAEEIAAGRFSLAEPTALVEPSEAEPQSAATEPAADAAPAEPTQIERDMRQPSLFPPSPFDYERAFDAIASGRRLVTARSEEYDGAKSRAASAKRLLDEARESLEDRIEAFERQQHDYEESKEKFDRALVAQAQRDQQQEAQPGEVAGSDGDGTPPAVVPEAADNPTDSTESNSMSEETTTTPDATETPAAAEATEAGATETDGEEADEEGDEDEEDDEDEDDEA